MGRLEQGEMEVLIEDEKFHWKISTLEEICDTTVKTDDKGNRFTICYTNKRDMFRLYNDLDINISQVSNVNIFLNSSILSMLKINEMRYFLPNFEYLFSIERELPLKCDSLDWNIGGYSLINEKLKGKDIGSYSDDPRKIMNYFMQVVYSLAFAEVRIGFTHHNLHDKNIVIRNLGSPSFVPVYDREGNKLVIFTDSIATIKDFSLSTVKVNEENIGLSCTSLNISPNTYALFDCYKLLISLLILSITEFPITFKYLSHMFRFFSDKNLNTIIENGIDNLLEIEPKNGKSVYDFIDFIHRNYEIDFISKPPTVKFSDDFQLNPSECVDNAFKYYSMHKFLSNSDIPRYRIKELYRSYFYNEQINYSIYSDIISIFDEISERTSHDVKSILDYRNEYIKLQEYTNALIFTSIHYDKKFREKEEIRIKLIEHREEINRMLDEVLIPSYVSYVTEES